MTSVWGCGYPCRERLSDVFLDFSSPSESDDKLSNQPTGLLRANISIAIILTTIPSIFKYNKKNLQRIFKIVLEAWTSITFDKSQDKPLKTCFLKDYFTIIRAKSANQIPFVVSFFGTKSTSISRNKSRNKMQIALFWSCRTSLRHFSVET